MDKPSRTHDRADGVRDRADNCTWRQFPIAGNFGLDPTPSVDRDTAGDLPLLVRSPAFEFETGATFSVSTVTIGGNEGTPILSDSDPSLSQATQDGAGF